MALTQQDVAERLARLSWAQEQRHVGVNADMVSKWERGEKAPSRFYMRLLCSLFGVTPGLLVADDRADSDPAEARVHAHLQPPLLLSPEWSGIELLLPKVMEQWRDDLLSRRTLLISMGVAPAAVGLEQLDASKMTMGSYGRVEFRGAETIERLSSLLGGMESSYHSLDPGALLKPLRALTATVEDMLPDLPGNELRQSLLNVLARANLLAGRLSFFDLHSPFEARAYLHLAREAADESRDAVLVAVALGHMAFLPASKHNVRGARAYVAAARDALTSRPAPVVASWVSAVESEIAAQHGDLASAFGALERSRGELAASPTFSCPAWFDFFDAERLSGFEGFALRRAGRLEEAKATLAEALGTGSTLGVKQRAVASIDLAVVHAASGDVDEGCRLATNAAAVLEKASYATARERLVEFRAVVPDPRHSAVRVLDEHLRRHD
jgi:transcriptional regulator with XRE-family HTH domain